MTRKPATARKGPSARVGNSRRGTRDGRAAERKTSGPKKGRGAGAVRAPFTQDEFDAFVKAELEFQRKLYEDGVTSRWPDAHMLARRNNEGKPFVDDDGKELADAMAIIAMPGLDDDQSREALKLMALKLDAVAVSVKTEAWYVSLPKEADPLLVELVKKASEEQTIHKLRRPLRREAVRLIIEAEELAPRIFMAEVTYDPPHPLVRRPGDVVYEGDDEDDENEQKDGEPKPELPKRKKILGPWEECKVNLPYPGFKRYLPEVRDGKKTIDPRPQTDLTPEMLDKLYKSLPDGVRDIIETLKEDPELKLIRDSGDIDALKARFLEKFRAIAGGPDGPDAGTTEE